MVIRQGVSSMTDYTNCPCKKHIFHSTCDVNCECWGDPYET